VGYRMKTRCSACGGELYNDTEFGMIQCLDCKWYTVDGTEMSKILDKEDDEQ
jgi:ribosomal protein L37AE/L43A